MKAALWAILWVLAATSGSVSARQLHVVASFTVLADMVRQVGTPHVEVVSLVGPNGDPHVYEPTPQDAHALSTADLVVVNGLGLEGWMDRLIGASGTRAPVLVVSKGLETLHTGENGRLITDPHAWNSAANGVLYVQNIIDALVAADPADAADYRTRGARYVSELRSLDAWVRREVMSIPPDKRRIITSHDAFGYLGAAYGIEFRAPLGYSTEAEPSAAAVASLIEQIKREKIRAVFLENSNDPRLTGQIASATGARLGGTLYAEALSAPDGPAPTYVQMFRHNIETLLAGMRLN